MAVLDARASGLVSGSAAISVAQTGNGASTHVADRGPSHKAGSTIVRIAVAIGATPTCTYAIEVSADGTNWAAATYADISTPTTDVATTFAVTTDVLTQKIVKSPTVWRYVRVTYSANTNVTNWTDVLFSEAKRLY
jgi:hypothetical protein